MKNITVVLSLVLLCAGCGKSFEVYDLRCESLAEPLAIDNTSPHFSWKIVSSKPMSQEAYEIEVASSLSLLRRGKADLWQSGRVQSPYQVMVPYGGSALSSRDQCWWRARVWKSADEVSSWSSPQHFGIGVLPGPDGLRGSYIGGLPGEGRSSMMRKAFGLKTSGSTAILHVCSLGYHEVYLNGKRVGEGVLNPAVSQLDKHPLILSYDVTSFLRKGGNELVLWTSSGWYKAGKFGCSYPGALVKAELDVYDGDGIECVLTTDGSWEAAWSGYYDTGTWDSHYFNGEKIVAAEVPADMSVNTLRAKEWGPVDVVEVDGVMEVPQPCEICKVQEYVRAQSVEKLEDGVYLLDFGKVVNGMLDISLPCSPSGTEVLAEFSDYKDAQGALDIRSSSVFVCSGAMEGDRFVNKFNHHVFRYVRLSGLETAPSVDKATAMRMRTDYPRTAFFECSDKDINDIESMVSYTMENLAFDGYMVDCANIERLGYGGDGNASTLSLQTIYDVGPLYVNWLDAWNDCIEADGGLPHAAPVPVRAGGGPYWCGFIVQAPWRTYVSYGDDRMLWRCYPAMKHWLEYVDAYTVDGLLRQWPDTDYRNWFLGDWAGPAGVDVTDPESVCLVNNCSLCQVYLELERIAALVGTPDEVAEFRRRYATLGALINDKFLHVSDSTYGSLSQVDMVYPMLVGIVPEDVKPMIKDKLFRLTEEVYGGNLSTGLVGVPVITEWATREREADFMYGMLKEEDYPGYLYMIRNGATSTWEHWNARRSRMHNCYNGIDSWFYQALGGLMPTAPGYRTVNIDPQLPAGIDWVKVSKDTPYGIINVYSRKQADGKLTVEVDIPVGITATVCGKVCGAGHSVI